MSQNLILHHYAGSPFAEKVRLMLGFKGLAWQSVGIPVIMPKPDLVALTGGYRKTPVLQRGADIYCDTALIAQLLEAIQPAPSLFPANAPLAPVLAHWADNTLFWTVIPYAMQPAGAASLLDGATPEALQAFAADRARFTTGMPRLRAADAAQQLPLHLAALNAQLSSQSGAQPGVKPGAQPGVPPNSGQRYLLGDVASIADFSVAHSLWFLRRATALAGILEPHTALAHWLDGMLALGHGQRSKMGSEEALAVAAAAARSSAYAPTEVTPGLGFEVGQAVTVNATDYGSDPVSGLLVGLNAQESVVARDDARAGRVHVHFPRAGFQLKAAAS